MPKKRGGGRRGKKKNRGFNSKRELRKKKTRYN